MLLNCESISDRSYSRFSCPTLSPFKIDYDIDHKIDHEQLITTDVCPLETVTNVKLTNNGMVASLQMQWCIQFWRRMSNAHRITIPSQALHVYPLHEIVFIDLCWQHPFHLDASLLLLTLCGLCVWPLALLFFKKFLSFPLTSADSIFFRRQSSVSSIFTRTKNRWIKCTHVSNADRIAGLFDASFPKRISMNSLDCLFMATQMVWQEMILVSIALLKSAAKCHALICK